MSTHNITNNALERIKATIDTIADVVGATMGPHGTNVAIEVSDWPGHIITNDGATVIKSMHFDDPVDNLAHSFLVETMERSNKRGGDGSSSTTVLVREALKYPERDLKKDAEAVCAELDKLTVDDALDRLDDVALVSAEVKDVAETVASIYREIGADGIIRVEPSGSQDNSVKYHSGARFPSGYWSSVFTKDNKTITLENPTVLVSKQRISSIIEIEPIFAALRRDGKKDIVVVADDIEPQVLVALAQLHRSNSFNIALVKVSALWRPAQYEDMAAVTGSSIVDANSGLSFKTLRPEHLGTCARITVDEDEVVIHPSVDIQPHCDYVSQRVDDKAIPEEEGKLRLTWLTTRTATLYLGASSEAELSYRRLKAEDCIYACKTALKSGTLAGGGVDLWKAGLSAEVPWAVAVYDQLTSNGTSETSRHNARDNGVLDSAHIVKTAVENAAAIASTLLSVSSALTIPRKNESIPDSMQFMRPR